MPTITTPIVGAHFRPPAKAILSVLPVGTPLILTPEPLNPYDPEAIMVSVALRSNFPISRFSILEDALSGTGYLPHDLFDRELTEGPLQLGYIPRTNSKTTLGGPGNHEVHQLLLSSTESNLGFEAKLSLAPEGYPTVTITTHLEG